MGESVGEGWRESGIGREGERGRAGGAKTTREAPREGHTGKRRRDAE